MPYHVARVHHRLGEEVFPATAYSRSEKEAEAKVVTGEEGSGVDFFEDVLGGYFEVSPCAVSKT